ncbi:hypothetical protein ACWEFJ_05065 [Actinosynnema sp. NPDC004786]
MSDQTNNLVNGEVRGPVVQVGTNTGVVNVHHGPGQPPPGGSGGSVAVPAQGPWYFVMGWRMGDRLSLVPLPDRERAAWEELVEAMLAVGFGEAEFAAVPEAARRLVEEVSRDGADRGVALNAYTDAVDALQRRIERRAGQDELVWFTIGRLVTEIRTFRTLDELGIAEPAARPAERIGEAMATLSGLVARVSLPGAVVVVLERFLAAVVDGVGLEALYDRAEAVRRVCAAGVG